MCGDRLETKFERHHAREQFHGCGNRHRLDHLHDVLVVDGVAAVVTAEHTPQKTPFDLAQELKDGSRPISYGEAAIIANDYLRLFEQLEAKDRAKEEAWQSYQRATDDALRLKEQVQSQQEWIDRVAEFSTDAATAADKAEREVESLKEQLEAAHEALRHIEGWASDEIDHGPPELGLILMEARRVLGSNPVQNTETNQTTAGFPNSFPASEPVTTRITVGPDPFSGEPGTSTSAGGSWGNSNQEKSQ